MTLVELANQPTQEQILEKVENIDLYSGTIVNADGKKLVPITHPAVLMEKMISGINVPGTYMGITSDYIYIKQVSSATHYLYNKKTDEFTIIDTPGNGLFQNVNMTSLGDYRAQAKRNANDGIIDLNGVLHCTGIYSAGSNTWMLRIDTSKISGITMSLPLTNDLINIPNYTTQAPKIYKTRKHVILLRNANWGMRFNTATQWDATLNPFVQWSTLGVKINNLDIVSIYNIYDAMEEDQDIVVIMGTIGVLPSATGGFVAKYNIVTKAVLSFSTLSVANASHLSEAPVADTDAYQVYTGNSKVLYLNKTTLQIKELYFRTNFQYSRCVGKTDTYIDLEIIPTYVSQIANFTPIGLRMKRERLYFDGSISTPLIDGYMPLDIWMDVGSISTPYYIPTYDGDIYISTSSAATDTRAWYSAKVGEIITGYKEVIE
ncbi:hypothetical protein [Lysinibacillus fusiformis]|uniref:hypothetical protein n=1 Tax=Lysinibacillus fusiformis TaxID=28031 RepID=UPI003AAF210D